MLGPRATAAADGVTSLLRTDPTLVAGVAVVALLCVVVVAVGLRRLRRPKGDRLRRALTRPPKVSVLMHPNPDPDAMACALGVAHLAESVGTAAKIQYTGQIRHQENRAFQTVLEQSFEPVAEAAALADAVVLVDHNEPRGFKGTDGVTPYAVVDHHPGDGTGERFTDVRTDYGACATIVTEYLRELGLTPGEDLPVDVATGLLYGILADTNHLTRGCSPAEFAACAYLFPGVDEDALDRIAHPQVDAEVLDVKVAAIQNRVVRNSFAVADVGAVSNVDAIPQAAEELLHLEGVTAVVVFGEKGDNLHLSARSRDDRVHMGQAIRAAVQGIPMASAGGHARMGGGQLSIAHMEGIGPSKGVSRTDLRDRLFAAMSGDT